MAVVVCPVSSELARKNRATATRGVPPGLLEENLTSRQYRRLRLSYSDDTLDSPSALIGVWGFPSRRRVEAGYSLLFVEKRRIFFRADAALSLQSKKLAATLWADSRYDNVVFLKNGAECDEPLDAVLEDAGYAPGYSFRRTVLLLDAGKKRRSREMDFVDLARVSGGAKVFSLYSTNLAACLSEKALGVRESLKGLAQIMTVAAGDPLFIYVVDKGLFLHGGFFAASEPFFDETDIGWRRGRFPYRVEIGSLSNSILSAPLAEIEAPLSGEFSAVDLDHARFDRKSVVALRPAEASALARAVTTADPRLQERFDRRGAYEPRRAALSPPRTETAAKQREGRLTVLLLKRLEEMSRLTGRRLRVIEAFRRVTKAEIAVASLDGKASSGEADLLLKDERSGDLLVLELKAGPANSAALAQCRNYAMTLAAGPWAKHAKKVVPVVVGSSESISRTDPGAPPDTKFEVWIFEDKLDRRDWWRLTLAGLSFERKM